MVELSREMSFFIIKKINIKEFSCKNIQGTSQTRTNYAIYYSNMFLFIMSGDILVIYMQFLEDISHMLKQIKVTN